MRHLLTWRHIEDAKRARCGWFPFVLEARTLCGRGGVDDDGLECPHCEVIDRMGIPGPHGVGLMVVRTFHGFPFKLIL